MVEQKVLDDLFAAFPDAILNRNLEFIADPHMRVMSCFRLDNCETREDAVEVVRCKDCKWFDPVRQECCGNVVTDNEGGADFTINFEENDFCSFGERRTDEKV